MGKADQKRTQNAITAGTDRNLTNTNAGIAESSSRVNELTARSDAERAEINKQYGAFGQSTGAGYLGNLAANRGIAGGSDGGGGGGGGGGSSSSSSSSSSGEPDYLGVFREMMGKEGGFDPDRLRNITETSAKLRNTGGNYAATDRSIAGLQEFAGRGGLNDQQRSDINRDTLKEFERTGGYGDEDIANVRSRANSGISSFYQNMQDNQARKGAVNQFGPGMDRTGFKMAREGAQAGAANIRDTEIGIADSVRAGRMDASKTLASNALNQAGLESQNTLSGYGTSGDLDLRKQNQVAGDLYNSGNLDLGTQGTINQSRLGASSAASQDANQKASISASSGAASAARADANARWAEEMGQRDRETGAGGLLDTYRARPEELMFNQGQLFDYRGMQMDAGQNEVNNRIGASQIPGIEDTISKGLDIGGRFAGMVAGIPGGMPGGGGGGYDQTGMYDMRQDYRRGGQSYGS